LSIGVERAEEGVHHHPVPIWEWRLRDVREDELGDLVCEAEPFPVNTETKCEKRPTSCPSIPGKGEAAHRARARHLLGVPLAAI